MEKTVITNLFFITLIVAWLTDGVPGLNYAGTRPGSDLANEG